MRRIFASSLLSLLMLVSLVWGGCISCEQYFMFNGAKGCCSPNGHCKTKPLSSQNFSRECKQIASDYNKSFDFHIDLTVIAVANIEVPVPTIEMFEHQCGTLIEPSPPDLQILHSTFRI